MPKRSCLRPSLRQVVPPRRNDSRHSEWNLVDAPLDLGSPCGQRRRVANPFCHRPRRRDAAADWRDRGCCAGRAGGSRGGQDRRGCACDAQIRTTERTRNNQVNTHGRVPAPTRCVAAARDRVERGVLGGRGQQYRGGVEAVAEPRQSCSRLNGSSSRRWLQLFVGNVGQVEFGCSHRGAPCGRGPESTLRGGAAAAVVGPVVASSCAVIVRVVGISENQRPTHRVELHQPEADRCDALPSPSRRGRRRRRASRGCVDRQNRGRTASYGGSRSLRW